jgi:hypothetical protein
MKEAYDEKIAPLYPPLLGSDSFRMLLLYSVEYSHIDLENLESIQAELYSL